MVSDPAIWIEALLLVNRSSLHHETHARELADVRARIAFDRHRNANALEDIYDFVTG